MNLALKMRHFHKAPQKDLSSLALLLMLRLLTYYLLMLVIGLENFERIRLAKMLLRVSPKRQEVLFG